MPEDRELRLRTIEGVLKLMQSAGRGDPDHDALIPWSNYYSTWFIGRDQPFGPKGTMAISAEEILRRIEAREALRDA